MSPVKKVQDRYVSDSASAQRSIRAQVQFIQQQIRYLRSVDPTGVQEKFLNGITPSVEAGHELRDYEIARIEKIYELTMRGLGLPSVPEHQDRRRKGLKFG